MKKTSLTLLSALFLSTTSQHAFAGKGYYEIDYGVDGGKLALKKSSRFIGVKNRGGEHATKPSVWLGEEGKKFKEVGALGGFRVLKFKEPESPETQGTTLDHIRELITVDQLQPAKAGGLIKRLQSRLKG